MHFMALLPSIQSIFTLKIQILPAAIFLENVMWEDLPYIRVMSEAMN